MPFYRGDQAEALTQALESLEAQTLRADEIVLIQDGPVGEDLQRVVNSCKANMPEIKHLELPQNLGLSGALNAGIAAANNEWLARMDADDICLPQRFEKQVARIREQPDLSILSSWIDEYDEEMSSFIGTRKLPASHSAILKYARWRCPFNHMTVMYRKSVILTLGGYKNYGAVGDDYELWARFLVNGYRSANIPEVLLKARTGTAFFSERRRGWKYFKNEVREINDLYRLGLINKGHYGFHFTIKAIARLSPPFVVRAIYKALRKSKQGG